MIYQCFFNLHDCTFNKNDISVPLTEIDSDEATPRCPFRKVFLNFFAKFIGKHLCGSPFLIMLQAFSLKEAPAPKFCCRFLQILKQQVYLQNNSGRLLQYRLISIKIQIVFKKETLAQVFSCKFCEISKNTFFTEHLWVTASFHLEPKLVISHFVYIGTHGIFQVSSWKSVLGFAYRNSMKMRYIAYICRFDWKVSV